jgi:hypothetical protein
MLGFLQQPYVFAVVVAFLTAALAWMYSRTLEQEPRAPTKTFFKTLAAGLIAGLGLTFLTNKMDANVAMNAEPFMPDTIAPLGV